MRNRRGFTLLEVLVVLVVIALIAGLLLPVTVSAVRAEKREDARAEMERIARALRRFAEDTRTLPEGGTGLDGLSADPGTTGWAGPYIQSRAGDDPFDVDPWGQPYDYAVLRTRTASAPDAVLEVEVVSTGGDEAAGGGDDLRRRVAADDIHLAAARAETAREVREINLAIVAYYAFYYDRRDFDHLPADPAGLVDRLQELDLLPEGADDLADGRQQWALPGVDDLKRDGFGETWAVLDAGTVALRVHSLSHPDGALSP